MSDHGTKLYDHRKQTLLLVVGTISQRHHDGSREAAGAGRWEAASGHGSREVNGRDKEGQNVEEQTCEFSVDEDVLPEQNIHKNRNCGLKS